MVTIDTAAWGVALGWFVGFLMGGGIAIVVMAACVLSSQISQREERRYEQQL